MLLLFFFGGCSCSQQPSTGPTGNIHVEPGAEQKAHESVDVAKHEFTLENGETLDDPSKTTFKAGEPFELSVQFRCDSKTDRQAAVVGTLIYKQPNGDEIITSSWGDLPEKVAGGAYHVSGKLNAHPKDFVAGGRYVVRVGNRNGVFYETPTTMVK